MEDFMNYSKIVVLSALLSVHCGYSMMRDLIVGAAAKSVVRFLQSMDNAQAWQQEEGRLDALRADSCQQIFQALQVRMNPLVIHTLGAPHGYQTLVNSAQFSPNSQFIVTSSADRTAKVWNAVTGAFVHTLDGPQGHQNAVESAQFSPNGQFIVTASWDGTAKVWNAVTGALVHTLAGPQGHHHVVHSAEFSPNGQFIVTALGDGTAKVWLVGGYISPTFDLLRQVKQLLLQIKLQELGLQGQVLRSNSLVHLYDIWQTLPQYLQDYFVRTYPNLGIRPAIEPARNYIPIEPARNYLPYVIAGGAGLLLGGVIYYKLFRSR